MLKIRDLLKKAMVLCILLGCVITSCEQKQEELAPKEEKTKTNQKSGGTRLTDEQSLERLKQIAFMLTELIKTPSIKQEVMDGVNAKAYVDENIYLKDLLTPQNSSVYRGKENQMLFDNQFLPVFNARTYLNGSQFASITYSDLTSFIEADEVAIYAPYSENWDRRTLPTITWNTIEERNDNIGYKPITNASGQIIRYDQVTVNDAYADRNLVWIVKRNAIGGVKIENLNLNEGGSGGSNTSFYPNPNQPAPDINVPSPPKDGDPDLPPYKKVHLIKISEVQLKKQLDPLLGLKNSGGSEVVFVRAQAFLQNATNPTAGVGDLVMPELFFTRKAINEQRWVTMNSVIDSDWVLAESQNIFGAYESDNAQEKIKITGKVKFKIFGAVEVELSGEYEKSFGSKNDRLYNLDQGRTSYFVNAKNPVLFELRNGWAIYTQNKDLFNFTMPYFVSE